MVDHGRRTYAVLDQASISQMAVRMGELMQEQMKKLPPEQRAMVEQMLKGRGMAMSAAPVTPTEFRRTPERAQQSGYDAVKNDVLRDGKVVFTMWSADWNAVEGAAEARPALESMASFIEEIPSDLTNLVGELQALRHMKAMNGFPVLPITYRDGRPGSEARLVSAASRTLLADTFETPAGFTQERIR